MTQMDAVRTGAAEPESRTKRLKAQTWRTHERLDNAIMSHEPFASREHYSRFLLIQYRFHCMVDPLYRHAALQALFSQLADCSRLGLIRQDMVDLGVSEPEIAASPGEERIDLPEALGWLYVAEGSNLGAAFLLKEAGKLDLSQEYGARHLAAAPEGRGLHWRSFAAALDALELPEADEPRLIAGAEEAFGRVHALVKEVFG